MTGLLRLKAPNFKTLPYRNFKYESNISKLNKIE